MKRIGWSGRGPSSVVLLHSWIDLAGLTLSCSKPPAQPKPAPSRPSDIKVEVRDGGPVVITTSAAEFQVLPSGFLQATLLKDGKRLTLDEPGGIYGRQRLHRARRERTGFRAGFWQGKGGGSSGKLGAENGWRFRRVRWPRREWRRAHVVRRGIRRFSQHRAGQHGDTRTPEPRIFRSTRCDAAAPLQCQASGAKAHRTTCGRFRDRATTGARMTCRN